MRTLHWTRSDGARVKQSVEETDAGLRVIGSPEVVKPAKPLPPPDPAAVEAARKRAEERGVAWVMHGATGLARWWMRIGRATQDVAAARLAVCYECPQFNRACGKCNKCGCGLRAKVSDVREVCPLGKW